MIGEVPATDYIKGLVDFNKKDKYVFMNDQSWAELRLKSKDIYNKWVKSDDELLTTLKFLYFKDKKAQFDELLRTTSDNKVHYILNLSGCTNVDNFYTKIKKDYQFSDYFGKNPSAIADCLTDYAYNGKTAFLEVLHWKDYAEIDNVLFYEFLDVVFLRVREVKRLENINYYIYLDEMPDFENPLMSQYKKNIVE